MDTTKKRRLKPFQPLKNIRLATYKYRQPGAYAITMCTHKRQPLFTIPALRSILYTEWDKLPHHFDGIMPGTCVVMHDHFHGILTLEDGCEHRKSALQIIGGYKSIVAHAWLCYLKETGANYPGKIWQYRFYDHIVRDETDFNAQTAYILNNPAVYEAKQKKMQK